MPIYDHDDTDWIRIGRYDRARRRSTWARLEFIEGPPPAWGFLDDEVTAVELCSGREGDDAFCRVERGDSGFPALLDVIGYSIGNIDGSDDEQVQSGEGGPTFNVSGPPSIVDALTTEAETLGMYRSEFPKTETQADNAGQRALTPGPKSANADVASMRPNEPQGPMHESEVRRLLTDLVASADDCTGRLDRARVMRLRSDARALLEQRSGHAMTSGDDEGTDVDHRPRASTPLADRAPGESAPARVCPPEALAHQKAAEEEFEAALREGQALRPRPTQAGSPCDVDPCGSGVGPCSRGTVDCVVSHPAQRSPGVVRTCSYCGNPEGEGHSRRCSVVVFDAKEVWMKAEQSSPGAQEPCPSAAAPIAEWHFCPICGASWLDGMHKAICMGPIPRPTQDTRDALDRACDDADAEEDRLVVHDAEARPTQAVVQSHEPIAGEANDYANMAQKKRARTIVQSHDDACPHERGELGPWPYYVWADEPNRGRCVGHFPRNKTSEVSRPQAPAEQGNARREVPVDVARAAVPSPLADRDSGESAPDPCPTKAAPSDSFFYPPYEKTLIKRIIDAAEALRRSRGQDDFIRLWSALDDHEIHRRGHVGPGTPRPVLDGWSPPNPRLDKPVVERRGQTNDLLHALGRDDDSLSWTAALADVRRLRALAEAKPDGMSDLERAGRFISAFRGDSHQVETHLLAAEFAKARACTDYPRILDPADSSPTISCGLRRVVCELIDAIATPKGRDFRHAWEEACLRFGRFGDEPTLLAALRAEEREVCALIVEKQASIRRMRAQSIADDSDRADGEAQSDDIAREESAADLLEYVAARVRQRPETAVPGETMNTEKRGSERK